MKSSVATSHAHLLSPVTRPPSPKVKALFGLLRGKRPDPRDLEQLIFDVAEHQREQDFDVPVDPSSLPAGIPPGQAFQTTAKDQVVMKSSSLPDGRPIAMAATRLDAGMLAAGHVSMRWEDFLGMMLKLPPEFFGFVLQGKTSWIVFDRQRVAYILSRAND